MKTAYLELILNAIQVRLDTISDDPESADDFETISRLEILESKIKNNNFSFTESEKKWLVEEIENRMSHVPKVLAAILGVEIQTPKQIVVTKPSNDSIAWTDSNHTQLFRFNDGGRADAGYKGFTGDCVARSIAIASGLPYSEVYDALAKGNAEQRITKRTKKRSAGVKTASRGIYVTRKWFQHYMASIGFTWKPTMFIGKGCAVHLRADELPKGNLIISLSKHYTAMIDGVIHDTYDPSRNGTRCVYGYWYKA